jgi:hypothetical protein
MPITTESVSDSVARLSVSSPALKARIFESIERLAGWLEDNNYRGYDTFDGLSARFVRPLTFETKFLRQVLQQSVRRFPLNLRPLLGIRREYSSKGMGFSGARLHPSSSNHWRSGLEGQG